MTRTSDPLVVFLYALSTDDPPEFILGDQDIDDILRLVLCQNEPTLLRDEDAAAWAVDAAGRLRSGDNSKSHG